MLSLVINASIQANIDMISFVNYHHDGIIILRDQSNRYSRMLAEHDFESLSKFTLIFFPF